MTKDEVQSLFTLAKIRVLNTWELANGYWPVMPDYYDMRAKSPWWLVKTPSGLIEIGWRKRVIHIDWSDTAISIIVTPDNVTKSESMVHAYSIEKALEYLKILSAYISTQK